MTHTKESLMELVWANEEVLDAALTEVFAERDALLAACKLFIERDFQQEAADHIAGQDLLIAVLKKQIPIAVDAEREACAKVCEHEWSNAAERDFAEQCAAIIRGREVRGQV